MNSVFLNDGTHVEYPTQDADKNSQVSQRDYTYNKPTIKYGYNFRTGNIEHYLSHEEVTDPSLLPTGPTPPLKPNCDCGTDHSAEIANITAMIAAIQGQIQVLEEKQARDDARPDVTLITEDDILEAVNNADDATRVDL